MKEFKAVIIYCKNNTRHAAESGWWNDAKKAKVEANYLFERSVPAGLYIIETGIEERRAA